ncbi:tyrosine-type recombinase/integrase [Stieleria sp. JC731]|uniref:tyrosine-type recombinase/integrase n=1 Tax=Pirellulaceae TaxID=2691357 RepID=UPI0039657B84
MMRIDLANARETWIDEAETDQERERRRNSDFLQYKDGDGVFADFHSNRHTFVTNLAASSANPKITQTLARHSDVNLTMNVYSHVAVQEQAEAVGRASLLVLVFMTLAIFRVRSRRGFGLRNFRMC